MELQYIISDLGGTLGKTGGVISRSRNKPEDFEKAKFINSVKADHVDFHYGGKRKDLFTEITSDQAAWIARRLPKHGLTSWPVRVSRKGQGNRKIGS